MDAPDLIVFGGTFDPPHMDHLRAVETAATRFPEARFLVLPAAAPAVAGGGAKAPAAPFADRVAMTRLTFADLADRVEVSTLEETLKRPNYTVATLRAVRESRPDARLGLLIGQDQAIAFPRWREPAAILELATLVVIGRRSPAGEPTFGGLRDALGALFMGLEGAKDRTHLLVGLDVGPAASHTIRELLAAGGTLPEGWLHPKVEAYVKEHALYGTRTIP